MHSQLAKIEYANGDKYDGPVEHGSKSGVSGTYIYANGDTYTGPFEDDAKHGENGQLYLKEERALYKGKFSNDLKVDDSATILFDLKPGAKINEKSHHCIYKGPVDQNEELSGKECYFKFAD